MTRTRAVCGFTGLLVFVPVTVCATITYVNQDTAPRCGERSNKTFSQCQYDVDCIPNAYCQNQQTCSCKDNHIPFRNHSIYKCLRVATALGDPCEEDIQCQFTFTPQSECQKGTCQCAHGSHYAEGRCYESVGLGKRCRSHRNCYIENSFCEYGICACGLRHHSNPNNTGCLPNAKLSEHCNNDDECVVENSKCINDKCDCKVDHVLAEGEQRCLQAVSLVGQQCEQHSQCRLFMKHSECSTNGTCECIAGSHKRGFLCFVDVEIDGRCETHHHCITRSFKDSDTFWKSKVDCVNGFCTCSEGYMLMKELGDCVQFSDNGATKWQVRNFLQGILLVILITRFLVR